MVDGFDVNSWDLVTSSVVVADDWKCDTGVPVFHIRWWGSYKDWLEDIDTPVDRDQTGSGCKQLKASGIAQGCNELGPLAADQNHDTDKGDRPDDAMGQHL